MVIAAQNYFAQRTAQLMFVLPREEMEKRLDLFSDEHQTLIVANARAMVEGSKGK